ncbi:hypothetical protein AU255_02065 [Methyloprofundus sedimenti]|uniref:EamA domain-containing protein n=1 Tax=Methyloprofundus sedimenti TaxID=1420851 RepID=A0A1V8M5E8_9GAMM|nr:hypothetical protein [Methyloprofundus sedimenti]OQK16716.1 hypothetical protein AU255_02065 [Methyloprofundus sedimenti]
MIWLLSIIAILCNVAAQVSIKLASQSDRTLIKGWDAWISPWLTPWIIVAIILYGASFVLTVRIFALLPLSLAAPAMAGATFLLVAVASILILGEHISYLKLLGMILITSGIYCLVRYP